VRSEVCNAAEAAAAGGVLLLVAAALLTAQRRAVTMARRGELEVLHCVRLRGEKVLPACQAEYDVTT